MPEKLAKKYEEKDSFPVDLDLSEVKKMGVDVIKYRLIEDNKEDLLRHSPSRLAKAISYWHKRTRNKRAINNENNTKETSKV